MLVPDIQTNSNYKKRKIKIWTWNTHDAKKWVVDLLNRDKDGDTGSFHC